MAHYEDIIVLKDSEVKCILCEKILLDNNDCIKTHLDSETHKKFYVKRLFIQNNIVAKHNCIHCFICETSFSDVSNVISHITNSKHKTLINEITRYVEDDGAFIEIPNDKDGRATAFCSICNEIVDFMYDKVKDHINSSVHRRMRSIAVQPYNGIFSIEGNEDELWCKICQVYFENYIEIIFEHVDEDLEHLKRLKKLLYLINGQNITIEKYLTDPKEDKAMCKRCNMEVACNVINIQDHIKGKKHKNS